MNIFTPGFLIAGGVVIVAVVAIVILFTQVLGSDNGADQAMVDNLNAAEAAFPTDLVNGNKVGRDDAPVKIVEYADVQCLFCLRYTANIEPKLVEEFVKTGQVQITYKNFPILGKSESTIAALGLTCAADQNKFWPLHNEVFTIQAEANQASSERIDAGRFTRDKLRGYAANVGIDTAKWDTCMDDAKTLTTVSDESTEATSFGITSTPGFIVNGGSVGQGSPTLEQWRDLIKQALDQANGTPPATTTVTPGTAATPAGGTTPPAPSPSAAASGTPSN
jgi:protein-disulfide isomerase